MTFKHPKTYTTNDFESYDTTENSQDFALFAKNDIARGVAESLGKGYDSTPMNAEGRIAAEVQDDAGAVVSGRMRLVVLTAQNEVVRIINEWDLDELAPPASGNRGDRYPFPIQEMTPKGARVYKSSPYQLGWMVKTEGGGSGTLSLANSTLKADGNRAERTH